MFQHQKKYGLRKAKNVTTLVGCELGSIQKAVVALGLLGTMTFVGQGVYAAESTTLPSLTPTAANTAIETPSNTSRTSPVLLQASEEERTLTATNLTEKQAASTAQAINSQSKAGTSEGELVHLVESPELDQAVEKAKESGIKVTEQPIEKQEDLATAEAEYTKQVTAVEATISDHQANKASVANTNQETDDLKKKAEQAGMVVSVTTKEVTSKTGIDTTVNQKAQTDIQHYEASKKRVEAQNAELKKQYDAQVQDYNRKQAQYEADQAAYKAKKAEYDRKMAELQLKVGTTGYPTEQVLQYLTMVSEPAATISSIKGPVVAIKDDAINAFVAAGGSLTDSEAFLSYISANYATATTQWGTPGASNFLWVDKGDKFDVTYTNLSNSHFADSKLSAIKYTYTANLLSGGDVGIFEIYVDPARTLHVYTHPRGNGGDSATDLNVTMDVTLYDDKGNTIVPTKERPVAVNFGSLNNKTSPVIDYSNIEYVNYGAAKIVTLKGSSVDVHGNFIYASQNNSYVDGSATSAQFYSAGDERDDTRYYGSAIGVFTSPISFQFGATNVDITSNLNGVKKVEPTNMWFAFNTNAVGNIPVVPTSPVPPVKPQSPEYVKLSTVGNVSLTNYTLVAPTVGVKRFEIVQKPTISKTVSDTSGTDVHEKTVSKGSEVVFTLKTDPLKAGRDEILSGGYKIEDSLPMGYEIDLEKITSQNPNYDVTYDKGSHTLTYVAKNSLVARINANVKSAYDVIDPVVYGIVSNDAGKYENTYSLLIGNSYKVYSNPVVVYTPTPPQPKKAVQDDKGKDIHGKAVKPDTTIQYVTTWDLDQYEGLVANTVAIGQGFAKIDNHDEKAVDLLLDQVTTIASDGETVTGLTAYVIKNLEEAPESIKALVEKSGVKIAANDEFVIWVADNPQEFYEKYVVTGKNITFTIPATVKTKDITKQIDNVIYQIDFGNGYVSNVVTNKVSEPPQPKKAVQNDKGKDIHGKTVKQGATIRYVTTWDLDQYKDVVVNAVAIGQGFAKIDNYDEKAVELLLQSVVVKDSDGKVVTGLTAYVIKNLEEAPEAIRALVEKSGVKIAANDEFVIWVADNPQEFYEKYVVTGKNITFTIPAKVKEDYTGGQVDNVIYQIDFGQGHASNIVSVHVPAPVVPEAPTPTPLAEPVKTLPSTGVTESSMGLIGAALLAVLGLIGLKRKEE